MRPPNSAQRPQPLPQPLRIPIRQPPLHLAMRLLPNRHSLRHQMLPLSRQLQQPASPVRRILKNLHQPPPLQRFQSRRQRRPVHRQ